MSIFRRFPGVFAIHLIIMSGLSAHGGDTGTAVQLQDAFTEVAESAFPAVVVITNKRVERRAMYPQLPPEWRHFFGIPQDPAQRQRTDREPQPIGKGSGLIVRQDGYILTNYHVIKDSDALEVKLHDGRVFDSARDENAVEIVGTDEDTDLAVLRIGNGDVTGLKTLTFADSDQVKAGQWAIAVGAPFNLDYSVTVGVVSQKGRYNVRMNTYENYIQTDASINPGNSGGPLLDIHGNVIGINDFIMTGGGMSRGNIGIGFAIDSNLARQVTSDLIEHREVVRPWLGVSLQPLTDDLRIRFEAPDGGGVLISQVIEGDPADKAGLKTGDVLTRIGDKEVRTPHDVQFGVLRYEPGDSVPIEFYRDGEKMSRVVQVGRRPGSGGSGVESEDDLLEELGFGLEARDDGVVVTRVVPGSPVARTKLRPGDVLLEVNRMTVETVQDVVKALRKGSEELAVLLIERGSARFFVPLRFEQG